MSSNQQKVINLKSTSFEGEKNNLQLQCHLMPCRINSNETTVKAKEYFWPTIKPLKAGGDEEQGRGSMDYSISETNKNSILTASFRGRPLQGRKVQLPEGYIGAVVEKKTSNFREFSYWNWDQLPNDNDAVVKSLQWIKIANAIHN